MPKKPPSHTHRATRPNIPTERVIAPDEEHPIACWFIDTTYNEETFFVRHAYFTGGDRPYDQLQKALRAEVDEDAWSALYSTVSRPFDPPETGKIAVKVINHYGDEVLKVYAAVLPQTAGYFGRNPVLTLRFSLPD